MTISRPPRRRTEPEPGDPEISLSPISVADAGEILTVQRAAFVSEALVYGDPDMPPLIQTLPELEAELTTADGWVARAGSRLVGAIRTRESDGVLLIGRIAIAPDMQGEGLGRRLLEAAEEHSTADYAELFTGSLSEANIRLYERCGYVEASRIDEGDGTAQVFLRKRLREGAVDGGREEETMPEPTDDAREEQTHDDAVHGGGAMPMPHGEGDDPPAPSGDGAMPMPHDSAKPTNPGGHPG
jgi:ribosomal protein S18 acetylase RimI-like enzyme